MSVVPAYFDRVNPDLLARIPPDAKTVLEIGCGAGALCEAYRRVNPGVEWHGFEMDAEAAEVAATRMQSVDVGDIEDGHGYAYFDVDHEDWYDVLLFGDVLEHLEDPWSQLDRLAAYVKPGGLVLASIPNVGHWTIIRDLMAGHWRYIDEGLLDRTHLRFFTLEGICEMFAGAGLQIIDIRGRDVCNQGLEEWIGTSGIACTRETRAYQYVVRAFKPNYGLETPRHLFSMPTYVDQAKPDPIHIHAVTFEDCCARPRIHEPLAALKTIPGVTATTRQAFSVLEGEERRNTLIIGDPLKSIPIDRPSVFLLQRMRAVGLDFYLSDLIGKTMAERPNCVIVLDIDDDPNIWPESTISGFMPLRACHAIQVSTEALAERVRQYNPNVMVFENQIAELPAFEPDNESGGTPNAGIFFGAQNRANDWKAIMPAINRIANDPSFVVWFEVVHDRGFFDALETTAKRFHEFLPYDEYRALLRTCDIALLPLEDTPFNRCKSDIKFLECAAEGVCALASPVVYGATQWITSKCMKRPIKLEVATVWDKALRHAIECPEHRQELATNAYAYVRDHRMLKDHFRRRLSWYRDLLSSREALNRSLLERVPELARPALAETCA